MRILLCLLVALLAFGAEKKPVVKKMPVVKRAKDNNCVDVPRVLARKKPVKKLDAAELLGKELDGVMLGLSVSDALELNLEMEAPSEQSAAQLEKMVGVLMAAQRLKSRSSELVSIDLPTATRVHKTGKTVLTKISLTDAQLEKLLEARYGRKLLSEARGRFIYIHGLREGTRMIPFDTASNAQGSLTK